MWSCIKLEPPKHIIPTQLVYLFSRGAPHMHIIPQFCNDSACCLVCQRRRKWSNFLSKFQGQFTKWRYLPMGRYKTSASWQMDERSMLTKYLPCFVVCLCVSAIISNVKELNFTKASNAMISYGLETRLVAPPNLSTALNYCLESPVFLILLHIRALTHAYNDHPSGVHPWAPLGSPPPSLLCLPGYVTYHPVA